MAPGLIAALLLLCLAAPNAWAQPDARYKAPPLAAGADQLFDIDPEARFAAQLRGQQLVVWEPSTGRVQLRARVPSKQWRQLSLAPSTGDEPERILLAAPDHVLLIHLRTGRHIFSTSLRAAGPTEAIWRPDGLMLYLFGWRLPDMAVDGDFPILGLDAQTANPSYQASIPTHGFQPSSFAVFPDGRLVVGGQDRRIVILGPGPTQSQTLVADYDRVLGTSPSGIVLEHAQKLLTLRARDGKVIQEHALPFESGTIRMRPNATALLNQWRDTSLLIDLLNGQLTWLDHAGHGVHAWALASENIFGFGRQTQMWHLPMQRAQAEAPATICLSGQCVRGQGHLLETATGGRYQGNFLRGQPHGQGERSAPDGSRYVGAFRQGHPHGKGRWTAPDGARYEGAFSKGLPHGRGESHYADQGHYRGPFRQGLPHGKGLWVFPDGSSYEGAFRQGLPHGQGLYKKPDGTQYRGAFQNGQAHGSATLSLPNGYQYKGRFHEGQPHGAGDLSSPDGSRYRGPFREGQPHGAGQITTPDKNTYRGTFEGGLPSGDKPFTAPRAKSLKARDILTLIEGEGALRHFTPPTLTLPQAPQAIY